MSLSTPTDTVEKLQKSLHAKAKTEPNFRFYSLADKIYRLDILKVAYGRCRANRGAPGVDGETFEMIEAEGLEEWIGLRQKELREGSYRPQPLRRVWIPKANGEPRPLGIPTIKDRVCQMAAVLILEPIFEADIASISTNTSTRSLASSGCQKVEPACRARKPDRLNESRVREIFMHGLTSGKWKRIRTHREPVACDSQHTPVTNTAPLLDSTKWSLFINHKPKSLFFKCNKSFEQISGF